MRVKWFHNYPPSRSPLALCFLHPSLVAPSKLSTLLTTLLLAETDDFNLHLQCVYSLERGEARIDEELVLRLYSAGDPKRKLMIAQSAVTSRLRPKTFRQIFDPEYARTDLSIGQRRKLAWKLEPFLDRNPRQAPAYEQIILELARSQHQDLSLHGILVAARHAGVDADLLALFVRQLKSRSPYMRLNTVHAFRRLLDRLNQLPPEVRDYLRSDEFQQWAERLWREDPDKDVRKVSRRLRKTLRETFGPVRRPAPRPRRQPKSTA